MEKALTEALLQRPGVGPARDRDHELVCYVGRRGAVTIADVMKATGVGRTVAYRRVARCVEAGLIERLAILHSEPSLLRAMDCPRFRRHLTAWVERLGQGGVGSSQR